MIKVRYFKKIEQGKKIWYSESWGEAFDVALQNGKIMRFACEFYRGDGWRITDRDTGLLSQNKHIPHKKELFEYIKDNEFLANLSRIVNTEYYERQKDELRQFLKSKARPTSL